MKIMTRRLDVGCGSHPTGDVNIDIQGYKGIEYFVQADIHHLPFRNNEFKHIYCRAVLEHHGIDIRKACAELLRVAKETIELEVPFFYSIGYHPRFSKDHATIFSERYFKKLFKNYSYLIRFSQFGRLLPHLPIFVPALIKVTVWKNLKSRT